VEKNVNFVEFENEGEIILLVQDVLSINAKDEV
jgi:hypothetical protein